MPRLLLPLALCLAVAGCDALGEPDRFIDTTVAPPATAPLVLDGIDPDRALAGDVEVTLDLDSLAGRAEEVRILLDGQFVDVLEPGRRRFTLPTRSYADGPHTLTAEVRTRDRNVGLLGLQDAPDLRLSVQLQFDQSPPTPVSITSAQYTDGRPVVTWTQNTDPNFFAYLVYTEPLYDFEDDPNGGLARVDTIYDRARTAFVGDALPEVIGLETYHEVRVSNRAQASDEASARIRIGPREVPIALFGGAAAASPDGQRLYVVTNRTLSLLSGVTYAPITARSLFGFGSFLDGTQILADADRGRLYVSADGPLTVFDPETLEEIATPDTPDEIRRFAVDGDQLYTVGFDGTFYALDALTGAEVGRLDRAFGAEHSAVVGRSPDGASVYVVDSNETGEAASLVRVDVSEATPRVVARRALPPLGVDGVSVVYGAAVTDDGRVVLQLSDTVRSFGPRRLTPLSTYTRPNATPEVGSRAIVVAGDRVYAVLQTPPEGFFEGAAVVELALDTLTPLREWAFARTPRSLAIDAAGDLAVFMDERTWILDL